ncbi:hypothetical protein [Agrobacterium tumefaciens]|nr:hypothetical protein [Agrobacterium tumefaciens]
MNDETTRTLKRWEQDGSPWRKLLDQWESEQISHAEGEIPEDRVYSDRDTLCDEVAMRFLENPELACALEKIVNGTPSQERTALAADEEGRTPEELAQVVAARLRENPDLVLPFVKTFGSLSYNIQ